MPHTQAAFDLLESKLPGLREGYLLRKGELRPRSLLYVGWRHDCKPWWHDTMCPALGIERATVLEIWPPNVSALELKLWEGRYPLVKNVLLGDVRFFGFSRDEFDVIFWDHGPEHVSSDDLGETTSNLQLVARQTLIYSCPWGEWPQGPEDGNEHEIHRNTIEPVQLGAMGMDVFPTGTSGQHGSGELLGIWRRNG